MAELADALDSGSSGGDFVKVQVLSSAPSKGYKKDIATENLDFIKVFSVFIGEILLFVLHVQKRYFSQHRLELLQCRHI